MIAITEEDLKELQERVRQQKWMNSLKNHLHTRMKMNEFPWGV